MRTIQPPQPREVRYVERAKFEYFIITHTPTLLCIEWQQAQSTLPSTGRLLDCFTFTVIEKWTKKNMSWLRKTTFQGCSVAFHPSRWWWFGAALIPAATSALWQPKTLDTPAVAINNTRSSQSTRCFPAGERIHRLCLDNWKVPELSHCFLIDCDHCDQSKSLQLMTQLGLLNVR